MAGIPLRLALAARGDGRARTALFGESVDRGSHRRRVRRRRAAAAADDPSSGGEHTRDHRTEVLGSGRVDEVALDALRQSGVRDDGTSHGGGRRPGLDQRLQTYERPGSAVDADGIHSRRRQGRRGGLGRGAVVGAEILTERHLGDDRQVARPSRLLDREQQRLQSIEGLEYEQVGSALEEPFDLLAEGRSDDPGVWHGPSAGRTERPNRAGDQGILAGSLPSLARQLGAPAAQSTGQLLQSVFGQAEAVRPECVRLDCVRACFDVLAVDRRDDLGLGQDELVEAGSLGDPSRVQKRAHCSVEQHGTTPEPDSEPLALGQGSRRSRPGARTGARGEQAGQR